MSRDMDSFDPNSPNAMFATILARIDGLKNEVGDFRKEASESREKTDGRLKTLEAEASYRKGTMAIIAIICSFFISIGTAVATSYFTKP